MAYLGVGYHKESERLCSKAQSQTLFLKGVDSIQFIICCHENNVNGMSQKEVISMERNVFGASSMKAVENHFDYLIGNGKL